jgi:hypothetical protein
MLLDVPGCLAVSLRSRLDPERDQQLRRREARVAGAAEHGVEAVIVPLIFRPVHLAPPYPEIDAGRHSIKWLSA